MPAAVAGIDTRIRMTVQPEQTHQPAAAQATQPQTAAAIAQLQAEEALSSAVPRLQLSYLMDKFRSAAAAVKRTVLTQRSIMTHASATQPMHTAIAQASAALFTSVDSAAQHCAQHAHRLTVATFNLWNTNEWSARKPSIVLEIRARKFDVIGLQEIRVINGSRSNQIGELLEELADLGYTAAYTRVSADNDVEEGIGVLSRLPILSTSSAPVHTTPQSPRRIMHASIDVSGVTGSQEHVLDFFATHLTWADQDQCSQVVGVLRFMNEVDRAARATVGRSSVGQVLLGDLNAYFDFEWPMDLLSQPMHASWLSSAVSNPCIPLWSKMGVQAADLESLLFPRAASFADSARLSRSVAAFRDLHSSIYSDPVKNPGLTFPTFHDARVADPCRPDRILMRSWHDAPSTGAPGQLVECDTALFLTKAITTEPLMFPSDHRGVVSFLAWISEAASVAAALSQAQAWKAALPSPGAALIRRLTPLPVVSLVLPAALSSSLGRHENYVLDYAFDGDSSDSHFYWANSAPVVGSWIRIDLDHTMPLADLLSISVQSGRSTGADSLPVDFASLELGFELSATTQADQWDDRWRSFGSRSDWDPALLNRSSLVELFTPANSSAVTRVGFWPIPLVAAEPSVVCETVRTALLQSEVVLATESLQLRSVRLRLYRDMSTWLIIREIQINRKPYDPRRHPRTS